MTRALLTAVIALSSIISINAQNTYLGGEAAVTLDFYELDDRIGKQLKNGPPLSGLWGFTIRQDIHKKYFIETGVLLKSYYGSIGFKSFDGTSSGEEFRAALIPLRLGTKLNLKKEKLFLIPTVGYVYGNNLDYGYGDGGSGGSGKNANRDSYSYTAPAYYKLKNFSLLQAGIGLERKIGKAFLLSFSSSYYHGFKILIDQPVVYTFNGSTEIPARKESKGSMLSFGVAIKYAVSNIWRK
jgi:hypothetical protein